MTTYQGIVRGTRYLIIVAGRFKLLPCQGEVPRRGGGVGATIIDLTPFLLCFTIFVNAVWFIFPTQNEEDKSGQLICEVLGQIIYS